MSEADLNKGERVFLEMHDGLLCANKKEDIDARGITISDAFAGEDVGVSDLKGLIRLKERQVVVCKVQRVQIGGSRRIDNEMLKAKIQGSEMVYSLGIESLACRRIRIICRN